MEILTLTLSPFTPYPSHIPSRQPLFLFSSRAPASVSSSIHKIKSMFLLLLSSCYTIGSTLWTVLHIAFSHMMRLRDLSLRHMVNTLCCCCYSCIVFHYLPNFISLGHFSPFAFVNSAVKGLWPDISDSNLFLLFHLEFHRHPRGVC